MRRIQEPLRLLLLLLTIAMISALAGCGLLGGGSMLQGVKIPEGKMLHVQQVLERYDADGNPVPQYLELWITKDRMRCSELDAQGNELAVAQDDGSGHIWYDAAALKGDKSKASRVFAVDFEAMKKVYPKLEAQNEGTYAGRECGFYLVNTGDPDEWAKFYVDKEMGWVLLCDAETFRLRTALLEIVPADASVFALPEGLDLSGGDGK